MCWPLFPSEMVYWMFSTFSSVLKLCFSGHSFLFRGARGCLRKAWDLNWALERGGQGWDGRRHSGSQTWHEEPGLFLSPVWGALIPLQPSQGHISAWWDDSSHSIIFFTFENLPERPPHSQKSFCRSQKVFCLFFSCLPRRGQPMVNITMEQARFGADPIVLHTQISQFFFFFCPRSNPDPTLPTVPFLPPFLPPQLEPTKTFPPLAMVQCLMLFKASPYLL